MISFPTGKLRIKNLFWTFKKFVFFFSAETEKNLRKKIVKQFGENI